MKPTAYLVNTARGPIVDQRALERALREGWIAGAALDVTDPEPLPADDPLLGAPNLLVVPHVGSATHAHARGDGGDRGRQPARRRWPASGCRIASTRRSTTAYSPQPSPFSRSSRRALSLFSSSSRPIPASTGAVFENWISR